jgi:hypothetical protein
LLAKQQNLSNQLDSLKDTNSRLIDYVKSIKKKVGTANSGKEFSEITEDCQVDLTDSVVLLAKPP